MSPFYTVLLVSIFATLIYGVLDGLNKSFVQKHGVYRFIAYRNTIFALGFAIILLIQSPDLSFNPIYWLYTLLVVIVAPFALAFLFKAMESGEVGLVSSVTSSKVIISVLFGIIFLTDKVLLFGWLMLLLIVIGTILLLVDFKNLSGIKIKQWIFYAFAAAILFGLLGPLYGILSKLIGLILFTFILEFSVFIYAWINVFREDKKVSIKVGVNREGLSILIYSIFGMIGSLLLTYAFSLDGAITAAVLSISPLITTIYGRIVYKEKLTIQQYIAILVIIIGVVLFSLNS